MKKIYLFIFLSFLLLFGCKSPSEPSSNPEEYFPLQIGNKWYYNSAFPDTTSVNIICEVHGQEDINHKKYYRIVEQNLQYNFLDTIFYRISGDTLFSRRINYDEQTVADFSLNLNDTAYWQNDLTVVQKTKDIIKFETPFRVDYGNSITFQRGIGITNSVQNGFVYYRRTLIKAEIK
ncbi:MAG: hypothetical protein Q8N03_13660 [Ignavibacteria bacterium]|nr:hypothetical protein [Ignavibacteria bacterium]